MQCKLLQMTSYLYASEDSMNIDIKNLFNLIVVHFCEPPWRRNACRKQGSSQCFLKHCMTANYNIKSIGTSGSHQLTRYLVSSGHSTICRAYQHCRPGHRCGLPPSRWHQWFPSHSQCSSHPALQSAIPSQRDLPLLQACRYHK